MLVKKTQLMQQGENTGLKSELTELKKESAEMKTALHKLQTKLQLNEKESAEMKTDMHKLQTKLQLAEKESEEMKTKLQLVEKENTGLKSELTELRKESAEMKTKLQLIEKENTGLKSELIDLRKVFSSNMDPQLKEELVNTFKVGSIEEYVQQNQEDIIDLRINDVQDMQIGQMLNQINIINTTLNGEIVKLDERLEKQLTNVEERLTNVEARQAVCGYSGLTYFEVANPTGLQFDRVYDEVDSSSGGELNAYGEFTAGVAG